MKKPRFFTKAYWTERLENGQVQAMMWQHDTAKRADKFLFGDTKKRNKK